MSAPITPAARSALEGLLAWKLSLHGLPAEGRVLVKVNAAGAVYSRYPANARVSLRRIAGHRDGDSTDCPGNVLYGELPAVRAAVARLAPRPVRLTLALVAPPAPAPPSPPTVPGSPPAAGEQTPATVPTLTGTLCFLDASPVAGAQILVQQRTVARRGEVVSERTLGEAITDATGAFSLAASLPGLTRGVVFVRALFAGSAAAGASVSEPLPITATAPVSGPPAAPAPTPPAPAPPAS